MLDRTNSIVFLASFTDACALWRMYYPHLRMPGSSFFCFTNNVKYEHVVGCDVGVVQRCATKPQCELIELMHKLGMKVIFDLDDNVWNIPPSNPAYSILRHHRDGFAACIQMTDVVTVSTNYLAKAVRQNVKSLRHARTGKEIPIVVVENRIDERLCCA